MRPDLPTGVVTLLFTDIEGSTRLLSELRGDYIGALHALGAFGGAMARRGDPDGLRIMRAVIADGDMQHYLGAQIRAEIVVAERCFGGVADGEPIDLDATIKRLSERPHPAPILR